MPRRSNPKGAAPRQSHEAEAAFSISVYDQRIIEDNANDRFSKRWGDPTDREHAMKAGMVDADGEITQAGWDQLNDDIAQIERNSMTWMRKRFINARDDGHDGHDDLVGSFWFDPTDYEQSRLVELASDTGRHERIDMVDVSYGDLGDSAFDGVSDFGASVLGGAIYFSDVKPEDMETLVATLDRGSRKPKRTHEVRVADDRPISMTYGTLPPFAKFMRDIRRPDPDYDDGRAYWPEGTLYPMELVSEEEISLAEDYGGLTSFTPSRFAHKSGFRGDEQAIYGFLRYLVDAFNDDNEEAGNLASSIMTTLGYEWI